MNNAGYLRLLANRSWPELFVVTTRSSEDLSADFPNGELWFTDPFVVIYQQLFQDCRSAEIFVHARLTAKSVQIGDRGEFFRASTRSIVRVIRSAPGAVFEDDDDYLLSWDSDDIGRLEFDPDEHIEPWLDVFQDAERHWYGLENSAVDQVEAVRLFRCAAELGSSEAYVRLGCAYKNGEGAAENRARALRFYKEGVRKGRPSGYFLMGLLFSEDGNDSDANRCFCYFLEKEPTSDFGSRAISASEMAAIRFGCLQLVADRISTDREDRHDVLNEFLVSNEMIKFAHDHGAGRDFAGYLESLKIAMYRVDAIVTETVFTTNVGSGRDGRDRHHDPVFHALPNWFKNFAQEAEIAYRKEGVVFSRYTHLERYLEDLCSDIRCRYISEQFPAASLPNDEYDEQEDVIGFNRVEFVIFFWQSSTVKDRFMKNYSGPYLMTAVPGAEKPDTSWMDKST